MKIIAPDNKSYVATNTIFSGLNRNAIINGNFDIWQRQVSFSSSGYSADRWYTDFSGGTGTISRQTFTVGQTDVPNNPTYFLRFNKATSGGAYAKIYQRIEDVRTFAGSWISGSFWVKSPDISSIKGYLIQNPGTGLVSENVFDISSVTSDWSQVTWSFKLADISSITNDDDSWLAFVIELWPLSVTGTIDFAQFQINKGRDPFSFVPRNVGAELRYCQRYYCKSYIQSVFPGTVTQDGSSLLRHGGDIIRFSIRLPVTMRSVPTVTLYSPGAGTVDNMYNLSTPGDLGAESYSMDSESRINIRSTSTGTAGSLYCVHFICEAEL